MAHFESCVIQSKHAFSHK